MDPADIFHFGFLVDDLPKAMKDWGSTLGISWAEPAEVPNQPVWTPEEGQLSVPLRFVYSTEGPVHIELVDTDEGFRSIEFAARCGGGIIPDVLAARSGVHPMVQAGAPPVS